MMDSIVTSNDEAVVSFSNLVRARTTCIEVLSHYTVAQHI